MQHCLMIPSLQASICSIRYTPPSLSVGTRGNSLISQFATSNSSGALCICHRCLFLVNRSSKTDWVSSETSEMGREQVLDDSADFHNARHASGSGHSSPPLPIDRLLLRRDMDLKFYQFFVEKFFQIDFLCVPERNIWLHSRPPTGAKDISSPPPNSGSISLEVTIDLSVQVCYVSC